MNTADDLLRRALEIMDVMRGYDILNYNDEIKVLEDIEAYLDAPEMKDEPVAWMLNTQRFTGDTAWVLSWSKSGAGVCDRLMGAEHEKPLYLHPPTNTAPMKPMPEREIMKKIKESGLDGLAAMDFTIGVRWAERHHGITGEGE